MKTSNSNQSSYTDYQALRSYERPALKIKEIKQFNLEFWYHIACSRGVLVFKIGLRNLLFLHYLPYKNVTRMVEFDRDGAPKMFIHPAGRVRFTVADIFDCLFSLSPKIQFSLKDGRKLLLRLAQELESNVQVVLRPPNKASPLSTNFLAILERSNE